MGLLNRRRTDTQTKGRTRSTATTLRRGGQWNAIVSSLRGSQSKTPNNDDVASTTTSTDLWTACKTGNIDTVRQIIRDSPELMHAQLQGRTPLYYACHTGQYKIVELLLRSGATDDELKTCHQSALNIKIRQLLQQYQTVDTVLEFQRKVIASSNLLECPTPACSGSSNSSSGFCEDDDDMYMHLFDTIEASCSNDNHEERTTGTPDHKNNCSPIKQERETIPIETLSPAIDCSDSLLTERANNHSHPPITITRQVTTTTKEMQNRLLPSFMCCREASLIDSDAMEDLMLAADGGGVDSELPENSSQLYPLTTAALLPMSTTTLTIETSAKTIEVQETKREINSYVAVPIPKSTTTTLKDRFVQRMTPRRMKSGVTTTPAAAGTDSECVTDNRRTKSLLLLAVPLSRSPRPTRSRFGRRNNNYTAEDTYTIVDEEGLQDIVKTSSNGEAEVVIGNTHLVTATVLVQEVAEDINITVNDTKLDHTVAVNENEDGDDVMEQSQRPQNEVEAGTGPTRDGQQLDDPFDQTRNISGIATATELSLARGAMLVSSQPYARSTTTTDLSLWSFDTFASTEIKKTLIPITTIPVPFEGETTYNQGMTPISRHENESYGNVTTSPNVFIRVHDGIGMKLENIGEEIPKSVTTPVSSRVWNKYMFGSRSKVSVQQDPVQMKAILNADVDIDKANIAINEDNITRSTLNSDDSIDSDTEVSSLGLPVVAIEKEVDAINHHSHCSPLSCGTMVRQDPVTAAPSSNFLQTVLGGCFPDEEVDDEMTLQTMSFENHIPTKVSLPSIAQHRIDSSEIPTGSDEQLQHNINNINSDRNVNGRVEQLIHETSLFRSPNSVTSKTESPLDMVSTTPSPVSSVSASIDSLSDKRMEHAYEKEEDHTSQSLDDFMDHHTDNDNSNCSTSTSESFYDDDDDNDDDDDDDNYEVNILENELLDSDDEISGPIISSIFCR